MKLMKLSKAHWQFILIKQGCVSVLINFFMNGLMAWVIFNSAEKVTLWEENRFAFDIVATTFFFTFFTSFWYPKPAIKQYGEVVCLLLNGKAEQSFFKGFLQDHFGEVWELRSLQHH